MDTLPAGATGVDRVNPLTRSTAPREVAVEILAYAAGVIDSDGSIGIQRETYAMRVLGTATQPTYSERVTIRQLEPEAVDLIHEYFGGSRGVAAPSKKPKRKPKWKRQPLQSLALGDRKATALLSAVFPYLRIKRRQAELCLEMRRLKDESRRVRFAYGRGHAGGGRRPDRLTEAMEAVRAEVVLLNRVEGRAGRRNPPVAGTTAGHTAPLESPGRRHREEPTIAR